MPQRLCLVLPSTAEFDSRTFRIASAAAARGHEVTVLARLGPGLPVEELHPAGYRIVRTAVTAVDGLPFQPAVRAVRAAGGRFYSWRGGRKVRSRPVQPSPARVPEADLAGDEDASPVAAARLIDADAPASPSTRPPSSVVRIRRRVVAFPRRAAQSLILRFALPLAIRAQRIQAQRVARPADVYHGMAYMGIPIALALARAHDGKAIYDARDIYVDAGNIARMRRLSRWIFAWAERRWARSADRVVTVNRPYAEVMAARWKVDLPAIIMNCSYRYELPSPRPALLRRALDLPPEERLVLYQGGLKRDRGIEQLMEAILDLSRATLVLLGYGVLRRELEAQAAEPPYRGRVRILGAVAPTELLDWVASADVVAMPIQPTTLNHRLTTPNKLFEAMAAGVPVVASDLPGMATIVRETGCGVLVDPADPASIADGIRQILDAPPDERAAFGRRALAAAHETYNWESQAAILLEEYGRQTGRPW